MTRPQGWGWGLLQKARGLGHHGATDEILKGHLAGAGLPAGEKTRLQQGWEGRGMGLRVQVISRALHLHCRADPLCNAEVSTKTAAGWKIIFKGPTSHGDEVLYTSFLSTQMTLIT